MPSVWGYLKDGSNNILPNHVLEIWYYSKASKATPTLQTDADGKWGPVTLSNGNYYLTAVPGSPPPYWADSPSPMMVYLGMSLPVNVVCSNH